MVRGKSVRNHPPAMQLPHAFSRVSVYSSDFGPLAQYSMNIYPTGFGRYPFGCSACRADAVRALEQPTASLADQYGANTGPVEPTSMGAFGTTHDSLRAQNRRKPISESCACSSFSHGLDGTIRVQNMEKSYKPAAPSSAQSDQCFRYALNWQTRTQGFFVRTAESNQTELGAMPFRFCRAQVDISQLLRIFITIVCLHVL